MTLEEAAAATAANTASNPVRTLAKQELLKAIEAAFASDHLICRMSLEIAHRLPNNIESVTRLTFPQRVED